MYSHAHTHTHTHTEQPYKVCPTLIFCQCSNVNLLFVGQFCRKVWLARFNPSLHREPDSKDEHKVKEFMSDKYEKKRYYTEPTESLHLEAREMNTPPAKPDTKQLRSLTGNSLPVLKVDQVVCVHVSVSDITKTV